MRPPARLASVLAILATVATSTQVSGAVASSASRDPSVAEAPELEAPELEAPDLDAPSPERRAREAYARGAAAYAEARFEDALAAFQEASALVASADLLFNIGLCHEQLEDDVAAIRTFEAYLSAKPDAPDAAAVRARIGRLERARARAAANANAAPPTTEPTDVPPPPATEPTQPRRWRPLMGLGVASLIAGAGLVAGGIVPARAARRDRRAIDVVNGSNPERHTAARTREMQDDFERARVEQIALWSAGGALAVLGIVLTAVAAHRRKTHDVHASAWLVPGGAGIGFGVRL